jgi:arylformamidase
MLDPQLVNPDGQPALPFQAAQDYAETVTAWAQEPLPRSVVVSRDIAYGAHRLQRYNVFAPRGAARVPVLVFWHGGGWTNGYREWQTFMALRVTALGLVMVAPSYRLAPECPLPDAHHDSMALLVELQRRLPYFGGAADHLYLAGHSAGGHLAALAALRRADRAAAGLPDDIIKGCLPISGIMDLHHPDPPPGSLEERVYTTVLRDRDATQDTVQSPLYWTAGNTVPFELTYGENDSARVIKSNRRLYAMLQAQGAPVGCVMEPGRDHFQTHTALREPGDSWYLRLCAMVSRHSPTLGTA